MNGQRKARLSLEAQEIRTSYVERTGVCARLARESHQYLRNANETAVRKCRTRLEMGEVE